MRSMIAAVALLTASHSTIAWSQPALDQPKVIVDGYGEVKTMPDVVTMSYTLRGEGATSDEAVKAMVATGMKIHAMLYTVDKRVDPKTEDVKVVPVKGSACKDRNYDSDNQLSKGVCAIVGYIATQDVTIRTSSLKDVGTMVGLASRGGAYDAQIGKFELGDSGPAKNQSIALAIADAQSKAAAVAAGSHVRLGQILTVSTTGRVDVLSSQEIKLQGTTRTEDLINLLPASFAAPVAVKVVPQPIVTTSNVTIVYEIIR